MSGFLPNFYLRLSKKAALEKAIKSGDIETVRQLLDSGLDANTPLGNKQNRDEILAMNSPLAMALLATLNARDRNNSIHTQKAERCYEIIHLLIEHGANIFESSDVVEYACTIRFDDPNSASLYISFSASKNDNHSSFGFPLDEIISARVSKLLVNNFSIRCNYTFAAPQQAIADMYIPSAIKYATLISPDPNNTTKILPTDLSVKIYDDFLKSELKLEIMEKFTVSEDTADKALELIFEKIQKITPDEIADESKFLKTASEASSETITPPANPKLVEIIFANITSPIRAADALADNVRGADVKAAFMRDHAAIIRAQQFKSFTKDNRKIIEEWSNELADKYKNTKKLSAIDLNVIFATFINLATGNKDVATQAVYSTTNKELAKVLNQIINPRKRGLSIFRS